MKKQLQIFFLFLIISVSFIIQICVVSGISAELKKGSKISYDGFPLNLNISDGIEQNYTVKYARNARINWVGYENQFELFPDLALESAPILDYVDIDENNNTFIDKVAYIENLEDSEYIFESNASMFQYQYFSTVFTYSGSNIDDLDDSAFYCYFQYSDYAPLAYIGRIYTYLKYDYDNERMEIDIGFYNTWYSANNEETTYYLTNLNLSQPIIVAMDVLGNCSEIYIGNVNCELTHYTLEFVYEEFYHQEEPYFGLINSEIHIYYNNTSGLNLHGGIIAMDFNQNLTIENSKYFEYDETAYLLRILSIYELNDLSYQSFDFDKIVNINETTIDYYNTSFTEQYYMHNLTDSNDYKLDENGNGKEGIIQFGTPENEIWENEFNNNYIPVDCEVYIKDNWDAHDNVLLLYDNSLTDQMRINDLFTTQTSGSIQLFVWVPNFNKIGYLYLNYGTSNRIYLYFNSNNLYFYDGSANLICQLYDENWYYMKIDFDSNLFNITIIDEFNTYSKYNNLNYNNVGNINTLRISTNTVQNNIIYCVDAIQYSWENDKFCYNRWIGSKNQTKSMNVLQLQNNESNVVDYIDIIKYDNLTYYWTMYPQTQFASVDVYQYSYLYTVFQPIGQELSCEMGFRLRDINANLNSWNIFTNAGSIYLDVSGYDYYTQTFYNYTSSVLNNFYNNTLSTDNRIGLLIQRDRTVGYSVIVFNSTDYVEFYFNHRLSFTNYYEIIGNYYFSYIQLKAKNYVGGSNVDEIQIFAIDIDNSIDGNWNMKKLEGLISQRNRYTYQNDIYEYTFEEPDEFEDLEIYYAYIYKFDSYLRIGYEFNFFTYNNITYSIENENGLLLGTYNESRDTIYSGVLTVNILTDNTIIVNYTAYMFGSIDDSYYVYILFKLFWYVYYGNEGESIIDKMVDVGVPLVILLMFPLALNKKFGWKGAIVGFIGGIPLLVYSEMLSVIYAIILIPISIIIAILAFREKGGLNG